MLKTFASAFIVLVGVAAISSSGAPKYPVKIGPTGRYLVDQTGKPFLIAGESPQAMMVNISEPDAELFFANRKSHGFNTVWINLICAKYTGGRADSGTIDGLHPFEKQDDFSTPSKAYFAHCDRVIRLAAKYDMLVMLDPAETGSYLAVMQKNGVEKCRRYGQYLGERYATFDNILWFHGNDYAQHNEANDALATAIAAGIRELDNRHLHTIELDWDRTMSTSLDDPRWIPYVGLSGDYTYNPVYLPVLKDYNRKTSHRVPAFMMESSYEFEHLSGAQLGTPHQLRMQEYTSDLCGATGQLYGNKYTWPFLADWKKQLDTPGAIQMKYVKALFEPRKWYELVPDQDHTFVTEGNGTFGKFDYLSAARTGDGSLAMAYIPSARTITVDLTKLSGSALARWYDPSNGKFQAIGDAPLPNVGTRQFTTPGDNADGPGNSDWVLVLETHPPR